MFNVLLNAMHLLLAVLEDNSVNSWKFWVDFFFLGSILENERGARALL